MFNFVFVSSSYSLFKLCLDRDHSVRVVLALEVYVIVIVYFQEVKRVQRMDHLVLPFKIFQSFPISGSQR